jgi:hypothetical protein
VSTVTGTVFLCVGAAVWVTLMQHKGVVQRGHLLPLQKGEGEAQEEGEDDARAGGPAGLPHGDQH